MAHYVAFVKFLARNAAGELAEQEVAQDVTDSVKEAFAEGADAASTFEQLADALYFRSVEKAEGFHSIVDGGVRLTETA